MLGAEAGEGGGVGGEEVVGVADGAAGGVVAGEEEEADLAGCVGSECFVEFLGRFTGVVCHVALQR